MSAFRTNCTHCGKTTRHKDGICESCRKTNPMLVTDVNSAATADAASLKEEKDMKKKDIDTVAAAPVTEQTTNTVVEKKNGKRRWGAWLVPITGLLVIIVLILLFFFWHPWNRGNTVINGDLHVKGSIVVDKDATVKGDLTANTVKANQVDTNVLNSQIGNFNTVNAQTGNFDTINANTGNIGTINTEKVNIVPDIPKVIVPTVAPVIITPAPTTIHTVNPAPTPTANNIISFEFPGPGHEATIIAPCDGVVSGDVIVNGVQLYDNNNETTFLVVTVKKGDTIVANPVWKAWFSNYSYEYVVNAVQTAHPTWTQQQ